MSTVPSTGGRVDQPDHRVVGHQRRDDQERDGVAGGGEDLGPLHAVGVRTGLGACRQPDGDERAGNGTDVHQHVAGVGQEDE